eukprot:g510.t1
METSADARSPSGGNATGGGEKRGGGGSSSAKEAPRCTDSAISSAVTPSKRKAPLPGELARGMNCFAQVNTNTWVSCTVLKVLDKGARFSVFVSEHNCNYEVPAEQISMTRPKYSSDYTALSSMISLLRREVSTPFGDAFLAETYQDGWCSVTFGTGGPFIDNVRRTRQRLKKYTTDASRMLEGDSDEATTTGSSSILVDAKRTIAEGRKIAKCALLASAEGSTMRVMRHLVQFKVPLDPPLPQIQKSRVETFSFRDMDNDLERRKAYEIELHGHNFFFSQWEGGPPYKVKIELHESATVGHLFVAVSERLGVPEEYLVLRKYWMRDVKKQPKEDSVEYLQVKGFGYLQKAPRDQYLFKPVQVPTTFSSRGKEVSWFYRRDEIIVDDLRPIAFRKRVNATTQFEKESKFSSSTFRVVKFASEEGKDDSFLNFLFSKKETFKKVQLFISDTKARQEQKEWIKKYRNETSNLLKTVLYNEMTKNLYLVFFALVLASTRAVTSGLKTSFRKSASEPFKPPSDDEVVKFDYAHVDGVQNTVQKLTKKADELLRTFFSRETKLRQEQIHKELAERRVQEANKELATLQNVKDELTTQEKNSGDKVSKKRTKAFEQRALQATLDASIAKLESEKAESEAEREKLVRQLEEKQQEVAKVQESVVSKENEIKAFLDDVDREDKSMKVDAAEDKAEVENLEKKIAAVENAASEFKAAIDACVKADKDKRKTERKAQRAERAHEDLEMYKQEKQKKINELAAALDKQNTKMMQTLTSLDKKKTELETMLKSVPKDDDTENLEKIEEMLEEIETEQRKLNKNAGKRMIDMDNLMTQMEAKMPGGVSPGGTDTFRFMRKELAAVRSRLETGKCHVGMTIQGLLIRETDKIAGCENLRDCIATETELTKLTESASKNIEAITSVTACVREEFELLQGILPKMETGIFKLEKESTDAERKEHDVYETIKQTSKEIETSGKAILIANKAAKWFDSLRKSYESKIAANTKKQKDYEKENAEIMARVKQIEKAFQEEDSLCRALKAKLDEVEKELGNADTVLKAKKEEHERQTEKDAVVIKELQDKLVAVEACLANNEEILKPLLEKLFDSGEKQENCLNWKDNMDCTREEFTDEASCVAAPRQFACKWENKNCDFTVFDEDTKLEEEGILGQLHKLQDASKRAEMVATRMVRDATSLSDELIENKAPEKPELSQELVNRPSVNAAVTVSPRDEVIAEERSDGLVEITFTELMPAIFMHDRYGCSEDEACSSDKKENCVQEGRNDGGGTLRHGTCG